MNPICQVCVFMGTLLRFRFIFLVIALICCISITQLATPAGHIVFNSNHNNKGCSVVEILCSDPGNQVVFINHVINTACPAERNRLKHVIVSDINPMPSDCASVTSAGETHRSTVTGSNMNISNSVETWLDKVNNVKFQFSYSPPYPFVGNVTHLNFKVTSLKEGETPLVTHVRIALIKPTSNQINNRGNYITFDNITSVFGIFSLNYHFLQEGDHKIIVRIDTKDHLVALASFDVPVLSPSPLNISVYGIYDH